MGWPQEQSLDTTLPYIEAARKGRFAMLQAIFGSGEKASPSAAQNPQTRKLSPELFDALFPG